MLEIMSENTPLLTVVAERFLPMWREFTGGLATEILPDSAALHEWFKSISPQPTDETSS